MPKTLKTLSTYHEKHGHIQAREQNDGGLSLHRAPGAQDEDPSGRYEAISADDPDCDEIALSMLSAMLAGRATEGAWDAEDDEGGVSAALREDEQALAD